MTASTAARRWSAPVYLPDALSPAAMRQQMRNLPHRLREGSRDTGERWKGIARGMLGESTYKTLKNLVRPQPRN